MGKLQKTTAAVSFVLVVILAVLLGLFLWKNDDAVQTAGRGQEAGQKAEAENKDGLQEGEAAGHLKTEEEPESMTQEQQIQAKPQPQQPNQVTEEVTMVFTGDVLLSQYVLDQYESGGTEGILAPVLLQEMKEADITMVNEEFPFSVRGTKEEDKQFTFRADPSYVSIFNEMGIDIVTVANNHALDFGTDALLDTFETLDGAGIAYAGAGETKERAAQPICIEAGGKKIGFLAASRVIPNVSWNIDNRQPGMFCTYDSAQLDAAIESVKKECDYVVVYVHWGIERAEQPEEYQKALARGYIDAGADLVIGAHPHVLQGIEYYNGKPIVYSLGNFIFNQEIPKTALLKVTLKESGETELKLIGAQASNAHTKEMDAQAAAELYSYLESISFSAAVGADGIVSPQ